jgi:hypothetical protein
VADLTLDTMIRSIVREEISTNRVEVRKKRRKGASNWRRKFADKLDMQLDGFNDEEFDPIDVLGNLGIFTLVESLDKMLASMESNGVPTHRDIYDNYCIVKGMVDGFKTL